MNKKKVLVFGASSSSRSINKQLVVYAGSLLLSSEVKLIDLNDYEMPIFSVDKEEKNGIPELATKFKEAIKSSDGIIISFAEHNGAYSAAFKNILDWISRMPGKAWESKPALLLATSDGKRGGSTVLEMAANRFPFNGGLVVNIFSLPSFKANFDQKLGIVDADKLLELKQKLSAFEKAMG